MTRSERISSQLWMSGASTGFGLLAAIGGVTGALKTENGNSGFWVVAGCLMLAAGLSHWVYAWSLCRLADEGEE